MQFQRLPLPFRYLLAEPASTGRPWKQELQQLPAMPGKRQSSPALRALPQRQFSPNQRQVEALQAEEVVEMLARRD
jgi:hypothetical protein